MRFVSATERVTVRESSETGKGSEDFDPPAEGWVVSCWYGYGGHMSMGTG